MVQFYKCGVYVVRTFGFDNEKGKPTLDYRTELWRFRYNGAGEKVIDLLRTGGEQVDFLRSSFSVDPNEKHIVLVRSYLGHPQHALLVRSLETQRDLLVLNSSDVKYNDERVMGDFFLMDWTSDGRYFWANIFEAAYVNGYIRIDTKNWSFDVLKAPDGVLGGDALNVEQGWITVHPGNDWFGFADIEEQEKEKRRQEGIGTDLYIENLFTRERRFVAHTDEPLWYFKPKWLSETELQYTLPSGETKIFTIPE